MNLLHDFFNHKSDANKYLTAEQQEDLENEFNEWAKVAQPNNAEDNVTPVSCPYCTEKEKECEMLKELLYDQFWRRRKDADIPESSIKKAWEIYQTENNL